MENARRTERVKLRNAANYSVMHRDDAAGKSIISGEIFLTPKKKKKKEEGKQGRKGQNRGTRFYAPANTRRTPRVSAEARASSVASEIKRFMVVSGALSLGPTYHGTHTACYPFLPPPPSFLFFLSASSPLLSSSPLCLATLPAEPSAKLFRG